MVDDITNFTDGKVIDFTTGKKIVESKRPPKIIDLDYFKGKITFEEVQAIIETLEYFMETELLGEDKRSRLGGPIFESFMSSIENEFIEYFECSPNPERRA